MKTTKYLVKAYCQDNISPEKAAQYNREYKITAENESIAEDKADKKYKKEMGFEADTVEVINILG